jgi:hypothetical protein
VGVNREFRFGLRKDLAGLFGRAVYYATMMLGPIIGGACAKWTGSAAAAFDFGAVVLLVCPLILWGFNRIAPLAAKGV